MKFPLFFRISPQDKAKRIYFESLKQAHAISEICLKSDEGLVSVFESLDSKVKNLVTQIQKHILESKPKAEFRIYTPPKRTLNVLPSPILLFRFTLALW